jgi:hypothetical protein
MRHGLPRGLQAGWRKMGWHPLWCALIVMIFSALAMSLYLRGPLGGDFDKHFMPAERWGVPPELAAHGLGFLYRGANESGWDGQFYYYIANDLTDRRHTGAYLDADAYRYQRIGLPLLAKAASMLLLQDWVSPAVYYGVSLALVLLATFVGAAFLRTRGISPYWILVWALAVGTHITVLNGLPDAAADALLLMSLVAYLSGSALLYVPLVALAALAREGHALFPAMILAVEAWWALSRGRWRMPDLIALGLWGLPLLIFGAWHLFIRLHFTQTPAQQATGILGPFMESTLRHAWAGLNGAYPNTPPGRISRTAGFGLVAYMALLGTSLAVLLSGLRATLFSAALAHGQGAGVATPEPTRKALPIALATLVILGLYACFGDTVIWNFTGYMKAANVLLFLVPLLLSAWARPMPWGFAVVALVCLVFFDYQGYKQRVDAGPITYPVDVRCGHISFQAGSTCGEVLAWDAVKLPGSAKAHGLYRVASATAWQGPVMHGPYIDMPAGRYRVQLDYAATGHGGRWELSRVDNGMTVVAASGTLPAAGDGTVKQIVQIPAKGFPQAEFRAYHGGEGVLTLKRLVIERLTSEYAER